MQREAWRLMIQSKHFYVNTFRFAETALVLSVALNILLGLGLFYACLKVPARHFYATNGVVPPIELTGMDAPNQTGVPLLAADLKNDEDADGKIIPE